MMFHVKTMSHVKTAGWAVALAAACMLAAPLPAAEPEYLVSYCVGAVERRSGGDWAAVAPGDRLGPTAVVRLSAGARLELKAGGATLSLFRPGETAIAALARESGEAGRPAMLRLVGERLKLLAAPRAGAGQAAGVRGEQAGRGDLKDAGADLFRNAMESGRRALAADDLAAAYGNFRDAMEIGSADGQAMAAVCAAQAALAVGLAAEALDCLADIEPAAGDAWWAPFRLVRAQARLAGLDYRAAAEDFEALARAPGLERESLQEALVGLGGCRRALGDAAGARQAWRQAQSADPASPAGRAAAGLLGGSAE